MFLTIDDRLTVGDLEERFSHFFPGLRLVLFSSLSEAQSSHKTQGAAASTRLSQIRSHHLRGAYRLQPGYTAARVETDLQNIFGLSIGILRRSVFEEWVSIPATDLRTLEEHAALSVAAINGGSPTTNDSQRLE